MNCATCGSRQFKSKSPNRKPKDHSGPARDGLLGSESSGSLDNIPYGPTVDKDLPLKTGVVENGTPPTPKRNGDTGRSPGRDSADVGVSRDGRHVEGGSQSSGSSRAVLDAYSNRWIPPSPRPLPDSQSDLDNSRRRTTADEQTETNESPPPSPRLPPVPVLSDYYIALQKSPDLGCGLDDGFEMEWDGSVDGELVSKEMEPLSRQPIIDPYSHDDNMADTGISDAKPAQEEKMDSQESPVHENNMDAPVTEEKQQTYADFKKIQRGTSSSMSDWYKNRIGYKEQSKKWVRECHLCAFVICIPILGHGLKFAFQCLSLTIFISNISMAYLIIAF